MIKKSFLNAHEYFEMLAKNFEQDNRFEISFRYVCDLRGTNDTDDILEDEEYMGKLYQLARQYIPILLKKHFINLLSSPDKCDAAYRNSMVVGSDGNLYKCTVHFQDNVNQIGKLINGKVDIDKKKLALWVQTDNSDLEKCQDCFFFWTLFERSLSISIYILQWNYPCLFI